MAMSEAADGVVPYEPGNRPSLPPFLPSVELRGLTVGDAVVDLMLTRYQHNVGVNVLQREGEVDIQVMM